MPDETLLSAARRLVRFVNIDDAKGGFLTTPTLVARDTLDKQVRLADQRHKALSEHLRDNLEDGPLETGVVKGGNEQRAVLDLGSEPCVTCGAKVLVRAGTCMTCQACGSTTGCS